MDQEYNYNNTDYEDTYIDIEARYQVVKNDDGTYYYMPRDDEEESEDDEEESEDDEEESEDDDEETDEDRFDRYKDEQAEAEQERIDADRSGY